jgi:hypothetical protein
MLKKIRVAVERLIQRQFTSNRRHGSHLFDSQPPGDAGVEPIGHSQFLSLLNIAHFRRL